MKGYPLKQPKATCALFFIACKINLGLVKNNGNPGGRGGGGGGVTVIQEIRVGRGVKKSCHPSGGGGGVDFFWNNPMYKATNLLRACSQISSKQYIHEHS